MYQHEVLKAVHENFGIDTSLRSRRRDIVDARMAIMVALQPMYSMQQIGNLFKFKRRVEGTIVFQPMSHCTVIHAIKQHKWRYHPDPAKRMVAYRFYGDVYDFAAAFLKTENFKPMTQIDMRTAIDQEIHLRNEAEKKAKALEGNMKTLEKEANRAIKKLNTTLRKVTSERDHYKTAFTQMYKEKKARDEKAI